jgi:hypothetical protein
MSKVDFFIPGASRSGTTSLYYYLKDHPEIFMPENKEVNYFHKDDFYGKEEEYESIFSEKDSELTGESSPLYFYNGVLRDEDNKKYLSEESAADRLKEYNPEAKIIISLRNPVDRAYSQYWKNRNYNQIDEDKSFREVITRELDGERTPGGEDNPCWLFLNRYSFHLRPWIENFPKDQIKIVIFDEWIQDEKEILEEICDFLEVESSYDFSEVLDEKKNTGGIYKSRLLKEIYRKNPLLKYIYRNHILDTTLEDIVKKFTHRSGYPEMSEETRAFVYKQLKEDIEDTEDVLGRDLDLWKPQ